MAEITWSQTALEDLQSIHDYVARKSAYAANSLVNRLIERTDQLIEQPRLGRMVPETESDSVRELIEGSYRIVYRLLSEEALEISRVWHSARGVPEL